MYHFEIQSGLGYLTQSSWAWVGSPSPLKKAESEATKCGLSCYNWFPQTSARKDTCLVLLPALWSELTKAVYFMNGSLNQVMYGFFFQKNTIFSIHWFFKTGQLWQPNLLISVKCKGSGVSFIVWYICQIKSVDPFSWCHYNMRMLTITQQRIVYVQFKLLSQNISTFNLAGCQI